MTADSVVPQGVDVLTCAHCGQVPHLSEIAPHTHGPLASFMPDHPGSWTVECYNCSAGMIDETLDSVLARWNRRTPAERPAPAVGGEAVRLREALEGLIAHHEATREKGAPVVAAYLQARAALVTPMRELGQ